MNLIGLFIVTVAFFSSQAHADKLDVTKEQESKSSEEVWSLESFRLPVKVRSGQRELRLARDRKLPTSIETAAGTLGGFSLKLGKMRLSAIGPALVDLPASSCAILTYGQLFVSKGRSKSKQQQDFCVSVDGQDVSWSRGDVVIEVSLDQRSIKVFNLDAVGLKVAERVVNKQTMLVKEQGVTVERLLSGGEVADLKFRFERNRLLDDSVDAVRVVPSVHESVPWFVDLSFALGLSRMIPRSSGFVQTRGVVAGGIKLGRKIFFGMPEHPRWVDFINVGALRFGVQTGFQTGVVESDSRGSFTSFRPQAGAFVGFGYRRASVDFVAGLHPELSRSAKGVWSDRLGLPIGFEVLLQYSVDATAATEAPSLFGLGLSIPVRLMEADGETLLWIPWGIQGALSFLF